MGGINDVKEDIKNLEKATNEIVNNCDLLKEIAKSLYDLCDSITKKD